MRFQLDRDGTLHYAAYYSNMPIDMNHNDSLDWKAGESGDKVIAAAASVAADLATLPVGEPGPPEAYLVGVTIDHADSTRVVADPKGKDWKVIDPAFQAMVAAFGKATGRPLPVSKLPQR